MIANIVNLRDRGPAMNWKRETEINEGDAWRCGDYLIGLIGDDEYLLLTRDDTVGPYSTLAEAMAAAEKLAGGEHDQE